MSAQFTPGPWSAERTGPNAAATVYQQDPTATDPEYGYPLKIKDIARMVWCGSDEETEANTRLVYSAPALYAALRSLLAFHAVTCTEKIDGSTQGAAVRMARAALAQADGEVGK